MIQRLFPMKHIAIYILILIQMSSIWNIFNILINPLKNGYFEVMNDIIGELEADHEAAVNAAEAAAAGISGSEMKTESRNSR